MNGLRLLAIVALTGCCARAALVAHWTFDEGSGPTAFDTVGGNHGTLSATGATFVPGGVVGGAVSLTRASGGYVSMPGPDFAGVSFSVTAWVQTTDSANETFPLAKHASGYGNGYFLLLNSSGGSYGAATRAAFYTGGAPAQVPVSTTPVTDGTWHFLAAVHTQGGLNEIYVDGLPVEQAVAAAGVTSSPANLLIGALTVGSPVPSYTGLVDDVRVFNHALTPAEVAALYALVPEPVSAALLAIPAVLLLRERRRRLA